MANDEDLSPAANTSGLGRRRFLGIVAGTAGVALLPTGCATSTNAPPRTQPEESFPIVTEARSLTAREWAVLGALQDRLLPSAPGSPGAKDVNAVRFLDGVLARGEVSKRIDARIRAGVIDLEAAAAVLGAASFQDLDEAGREAAMASISRRYKGRRFLRYVLIHTLEAFLGDPVHGGNPNEIAWQYLGHRAGYPRPALAIVEGP